MNTTDTPSAEYLAAMDVFRAASKAFRAAEAAFRAGAIDDTRYLAAHEAFQSAEILMDEAEYRERA